MKRFKIAFNGASYFVNYITKPNEAEIISKRLKDSEVQNFGIDIETYKKGSFIVGRQERAGLDPYHSGISTVQIYDGREDVYVFDIIAVGLDWLKQITTKNFVAHYGIFEIKHLSHNSFCNLSIGCSMLLSILVDRAERSPYVDTEEESEEDEEDAPSWKGYGLDAIIGRLFDVRIDKKWQTYDWGIRPLENEPLTYSALDAILTYKIAEVQIPKINEYKMQKHYKLLKEMQHVICDMELNGVYIDPKKHQKLIKSWVKREKKEALECAKHFGDINLGSTKQLAKWATEKYDADTLANWVRSKKTKALGFGKDALATMQHLPEIKALLEYKKTSKLISTYGESLNQQTNPITKRVHCSFSLGETRTGRLSSREPNLQNLPRDSGMRGVFVPSPAKKLIVADFNQIELRVAGHVSNDPVINGAYKRGDDLHSIFASKMFSVPLSEVSKEQRQIAKSANFGAIYGMGANKFITYTLSSTGGAVSLSFEEAKKTIDTLWLLYAQYGKWCKEVRGKAEMLGFVRTPLGKVRKLHQKEVYTKAPNTIIQGGAFEVMGASAIDLRYSIQKEGIEDSAVQVNSVHDELVTECDEEIAVFVKGLVERSMVAGMLKVFPKAITNGLAAAKICDSWGEK